MPQDQEGIKDIYFPVVIWLIDETHIAILKKPSIRGTGYQNYTSI